MPARSRRLDLDTILDSVVKTGRLVIVHEAPRTCGLGAEIAATVAEQALYDLLAPIRRVTGYDTIMPLYRLEHDYIPGVARIVDASVLRWRTEMQPSGVPRMTVFKLPDLGEGLSEAEILRWHVKVGDQIEVDAPMLSVETAKAVVEVPSPSSGTVTALHAQPGDRIEIGAPLIEFAADAAASQAAARATLTSASDDSGTVVGHMPGMSDADAAALEAANAVTGPRVRAVPAARALARSLGVDVGTLTGTGRGGLITLDDVMAVGLPGAQRRQQDASGAARRGRRPPAAMSRYCAACVARWRKAWRCRAIR